MTEEKLLSSLKDKIKNINELNNLKSEYLEKKDQSMN